MRVHEYCCPSCGVIVLSGGAIVDDVCVICAPYDEKNEDFSILLLQDALEDSLKRKSMGAKRPEPVQRPSNVMISPDQATMAIDLDNFSKTLLDILYEDAKFGTANQIVKDGGKQILEGVNALIRAKLLDPSAAGRTSPLILTKEDTDRYLGILELIHTRYTQAHKIFVSNSDDFEEARKFSYGMFWHIGSLVRIGQLATTVSPWVTGAQQPRF